VKLSARALEHRITLTIKRLDWPVHCLYGPQPSLHGWMSRAFIVKFLVGVLVKTWDGEPDERPR